MMEADINEKSMQSFRIPLEIVRDDPKHEQHHYSSTPVYGGDLLVTVTYKRNVIMVSFHYQLNKSTCLVYIQSTICTTFTKNNEYQLFVKNSSS